MVAVRQDGAADRSKEAGEPTKSRSLQHF